MGRWMMEKLSVFFLLLFLSLFQAPAQAEMYVAGQVGVSVPNKVSSVEGVGSDAGITTSDLDLQNSVMYGAKLGYFFDSMKWLGVETEVFKSNPNIKEQRVTARFGGATASGVLSGQDVRVITWTPVSAVVRYQAGSFEPYAGIGPGVFFARMKDGGTGETSSSNRVGLATQVGLRYLVSQHLSVFGEWKYNYVHFNFSESSPTQATGGFKGDYSANIFAFGVGYHF